MSQAVNGVATYQPGQRVVHPDFGNGVVVSTSPDGFVRAFFATGERQFQYLQDGFDLAKQRGNAGRALGFVLGEPLSLRRDELDLDNGRAVLRTENTKGRRGEVVNLDPAVIEHLRAIASFEPNVFPWYHNRRSLWREFLRIQEAAGIHLPCHDSHEHTPSCHVYGFHDLRRAFATVNAEALGADELQRLMRHRCY